MTNAELKLLLLRKPALRSRNDHLSPACAKPQPSAGPAPDEARAHEAPSAARYVVQFVSFRIQPTDLDNSVVKWHLDSLRFCGAIPNDTNLDIQLIIAPDVRVKTKAEERTEITLTPIVHG